MSADLAYRPRAGDIPTDPGVYRFRDGDKRILYVGKAKNLRQRLSNYFGPLESLHERTRRMVTTAKSVEWTVVGSDIEALQLEYTWIKEFDPPFNVKFRDDKSYPFLVVTLAEEAPRTYVTRNAKIRGAQYFGPYPKVWAITETLDLLARSFQIRTCNAADYKRAMSTGRPCFRSQIGRCGGPCSQVVTIEEHRKRVDRFIRFMQSYDTSIVDDVRREMLNAAAELRFEEAARLRERVFALEEVLAKSTVLLSDNANTDIVGVAEDELSAAIQVFHVRGGRILGTRSILVDKELDLLTEDLVAQTLEHLYGDGEAPAPEVIVPTLPSGREDLERWLQGLRPRAGRVHIHRGQRGDKAELLRTAARNAAGELRKYKVQRTSDYTARSDALAELGHALGLAEAPLRIEAYDISHLGGTNVVASMVVFEDGLPKKSQYRSFNIQGTNDDTASMYQVISRRLARLSDTDEEEGSRRFAYRPSLLLVDGGQPQVAAAKQALDDAGVHDIAVVGIAKRLEELWLPGEDYPVIVSRDSAALYLVQYLRDEAHRFAITHQRKRRSRSLQSQLSEIPGVGPSRVQALLKHFGSVTRLRRATPAELTEVSGIGAELAAVIQQSIGTDTVPTDVRNDDNAGALEDESDASSGPR